MDKPAPHANDDELFDAFTALLNEGNGRWP
jgi:hypothetical protein